MFSSRWAHDTTKAPLAFADKPSMQLELAGDALFEALVCEFQWTAIYAGAVAQLFNAAVQFDRTWIAKNCWNCLPADAPVISLALRSWDSIALDEPTARVIAESYVNLADVKDRTLRFLGRNPLSPLGKTSELQIEQLAASWRYLASDLISAVTALDGEIGLRLQTEYGRNTDSIVTVLAAAAKGKWNIVDKNGTVTLPALAQRRREQRFTVLQPCRISKSGRTITGTARDISRSGMRLACNSTFLIQELVSVQFNNGRRFSGHVMWTKDGQIGIKFETPLSYRDPLFGI